MIAARRMLAKKMAFNTISSQVRLTMPLLAAQQSSSLMTFNTTNMLMWQGSSLRSYGSETVEERNVRNPIDPRVPRFMTDRLRLY